MPPPAPGFAAMNARALLALLRRELGYVEVRKPVVANAVSRILASDADAPSLLEGLQSSATGEDIFVACLADDPIGWLADQLRPAGDALIASLMVADVMVAMTQMATRADLDWPTLDALGWHRDQRIGDLMAQNSSGRPLQLRV